MPYSITPPKITLETEFLTPTSFAPFGTVISSPISASNLHSFPQHLPPNAIPANQNTAIKFPRISPLQDKYARHSPSKTPAEGQMSMFICLPRKLRQRDSTQGGGEAFDVKILERHPFTTQTFVPMGLAASDERTRFLIVVAPSLPAPAQSLPTAPSSPPDLSRVRAFLARGDHAVTYAAGTWHAPMVVVGARAVEFVVIQFSNGVEEEDCQEVELEIGGSEDGGISVLLHDIQKSRSSHEDSGKRSKI